MIISALINVATAISITSSNPTTLVFNDPIQYVSIGKTGDFSFHLNNNKKVIVIQPLKDIKMAEMIVLTDEKNYQFKIHSVSDHAQNYYQITNGHPNGSYTLIKAENGIELFEGVSSMLLKNKTNSDQYVNDELVKSQSTINLPKGGSVYINEKRIL